MNPSLICTSLSMKGSFYFKLIIGTDKGSAVQDFSITVS
jgi:hypothetical protein